jgi:putative NADH-flavin reductase
MHIVLLGDAGAIAQRITREALSRGHRITAVVRNPKTYEKPAAGVEVVQGDATDPKSVAAVARGADAIVNAISPRPGGEGRPASSLADAANAVIEGAKAAGVKRLLVVGGAGTLEVAPGVQLLDTPGFPDIYKPEALEGRAAYAVYREKAAPLEWTYVAPAAVIQPGERTGKYRTSNDQLLADASGKSTITHEDYAVAMLDELENPKNIGRRLAVAY